MDIEGFSKTINNLDLTDVFRTLSSNVIEYTFFQAHIE